MRFFYLIFCGAHKAVGLENNLVFQQVQLNAFDEENMCVDCSGNSFYPVLLFA